MLVTKTMLITAGMPPWDVNKFACEWPAGAELNSENYRRAQEIGLCPSALFSAVATRDQYENLGRKISAYSAEAEAKRRQADKQHQEQLAQIERQKEASQVLARVVALAEALYVAEEA